MKYLQREQDARKDRRANRTFTHVFSPAVSHFTATLPNMPFS